MRKVPMRKRETRRGFTVAEVIVALTVIVIISAAAVVLISAQIRNESRAARTVTATNMAENAIECFRYACDTKTEDTEILAAFEDAFGEGGCGYTKNGNGKYEKNGVFGTVDIDTQEKKITVTVTNTSGETIVSVENFKAKE